MSLHVHAPMRPRVANTLCATCVERRAEGLCICMQLGEQVRCGPCFFRSLGNDPSLGHCYCVFEDEDEPERERAPFVPPCTQHPADIAFCLHHIKTCSGNNRATWRMLPAIAPSGPHWCNPDQLGYHLDLYRLFFRSRGVDDRLHLPDNPLISLESQPDRPFVYALYQPPASVGIEARIARLTMANPVDG